VSAQSNGARGHLLFSNADRCKHAVRFGHVSIKLPQAPEGDVKLLSSCILFLIVSHPSLCSPPFIPISREGLGVIFIAFPSHLIIHLCRGVPNFLPWEFFFHAWKIISHTWIFFLHSRKFFSAGLHFCKLSGN